MISLVLVCIDSNLQKFKITGTVSGGVNDSKNFGQVVFNIDEDSTTEGTEVFTITLDDHPSVSFTITAEDTSTDPVSTSISIDGHGMTGLDSGTHEGYLLMLSDVVLNTAGSYSWSVTGIITSSDFSYISINGQNVSSQDLTNLSGTFTGNVGYNLPI